MQIEIDDLSRPQVLALLNEHLTNMYELSPPENVFALDVTKLRAPNITFWCVWESGEMLGCGALKERSAIHGEVKSMRTPKALRRRGAGRAVLATGRTFETQQLAAARSVEPHLPVVQVVATIRHATVSTPGQFTFSRYGTTNEALRVYYGVEGETIVAYQNGKPVISYRGLPGYVDIPARQRTVTVPVIPVTPPPNGVTVTVTVRAEGDYSVGPARMAVVQIGKP